jgi:hypothetical protein
MTDSFEEREKAYESKWARDEEHQFKVLARRNKLIGLWAAGEITMSGASAEEYAKAVIQAGLSGKGKDPVFEKIRNDLATAKVTVSDHTIHRKMEELFTLASKQIASEQKG